MMDLVWSVVPSKGNPPPPFIVTRRGSAHEWVLGSCRFPPNRGVQWSDTVESTMWGMALGVAAVVDIALGLAEIAPSSCQSLRAAWSSLLEVRSSICGAVASGGPAGQSLACTSGGGARGGPEPPGRSAGARTRKSGRHVEVPDPSRGVRDSGCG